MLLFRITPLLACEHDQQEFVNSWFFASVYILNLVLKSFSSFFSGSVAKSDGHSAFVAEVKRSLPPEKSLQLFQTISCYKKTDDYEKLVVDVMDVFRDNFNLLVSKFPPLLLYLQ